jgi:N-acylneuraminate cytidylyltransferase/CMP-N,N'-diacetyllegionaminic acid synthase
VARGGSKSIPRKNLALLAGKPLIAWTIEAALQCPSAGRVLVSTDDPEIADVARTLGADAPFVRPDALARDDTPTMPVVIHALEWLEANESYSPNRVLLLQPTSPLRTSGDIAAAIALAEEQRAESIVSVSPASSHPHLIKRITPEGLLEDLLPHAQIDRRQDLEPVYALNGAIYLTLRSQLLKHQSFYPTRTHAYVMPAERSLDIDSPWDLELCDLILRHRIARD